MKKINELKNVPMSAEETIVFLENLSKELKIKNEGTRKIIQVLKDDFEVFEKTGQMWEPTVEDFDRKTEEEKLALFIKNRPNV